MTEPPPHIQDLIAIAVASEDQSYREYSKPMDFLLDYSSPDSVELEPWIKKIVAEIEQYEVESGARKNKRPHNAQRRFAAGVRSLVLNLLQLRKLIANNLYLAVSLNRNSYSLSPDRRYVPEDMTYDGFHAAYAGLIGLGYIRIHRKGCYNKFDGAGLCTRIAPTDKLTLAYDRLAQNKTVIFAKPKNAKEETIILKDANGEKTEYKDTPFTRKARRNLTQINNVLSAQEFTLDLPDSESQSAMAKAIEANHSENPDHALPYVDFNSVKLYRIFNEGRFGRGGRFYRGWWQNLPQKYRKYIRIDGRPTIELDYSRYHITMMYAELGIPLTFDAYDIHPRVSKEITKKTINALISSKGVTKPHPDFDESEAGLNWKTFIELIKEKHKPLIDADMLMSGHGLTLQFQDSEIAEAILLHFIKQGIPCLPIHDSFIIDAEYSDELKEVMLLEFKRVYDTDINISNK